MLTGPLVFGHLRLVAAFQRPGDDPDGRIGERLSLDPPFFAAFLLVLAPFRGLPHEMPILYSNVNQ
jgi:hypothetical protein